MTLSEEAQIVEWQLKWIKKNAGDLTERELELVISFEEQFNRRGILSKRQMEVLEDIYNRRT